MRPPAVGPAGAAAVLAALLALVAAPTAHASPTGSDDLLAQATTVRVGDTAIFELHDGTLVKGVLLDKVPSGYLVREAAGDGSRVLAYEDIAQIHRVGEPRSGEDGGSPEAGDGPVEEAPVARAPGRFFFMLDPDTETEYAIRPGGSSLSAIPRKLFPRSEASFVIYDQDGQSHGFRDFYRAVGKGAWLEAEMARLEAMRISSLVLTITGPSLAAVALIVLIADAASGSSYGYGYVAPPAVFVLTIAAFSCVIPGLILNKVWKRERWGPFRPETVYDAALQYADRHAGGSPSARPGGFPGLDP